MSIRHAVLALLAESPLHGYAVPEALERRFGPTWEIDASRAYQILSSLARAGLIVRASERAGRRPTRQVYTVSESGRSALRDWLRALPRADDPIESVLLRLLLAPGLRDAALDEWLECAIAQQRRARGDLLARGAEIGSVRSREADGDETERRAIADALGHVWSVRRRDAELEILEQLRHFLTALRAGDAPKLLLRSLLKEARSPR